MDIIAECIRESDGGGIPSLKVRRIRAEGRKVMSNFATSLGVEESGGVMIGMYFREAGADTPCNVASVTVPRLLPT